MPLLNRHRTTFGFRKRAFACTTKQADIRAGRINQVAYTTAQEGSKEDGMLHKRPNASTMPKANFLAGPILPVVPTMLRVVSLGAWTPMAECTMRKASIGGERMAMVAGMMRKDVWSNRYGNNGYVRLNLPMDESRGRFSPCLKPGACAHVLVKKF